MHTTTSRRLGASLTAFLSAPSCRVTERRVCRSAAQAYQNRAIAHSSTQRQQTAQAPASASSSVPRPSATPPSPSQQGTGASLPRAASAPKPSTTLSASPQQATRTPVPQTAAAKVQPEQHALSPAEDQHSLRSLTDGLQDPPPTLSEDEKQVDWTRSYHGLSSTPFTAEQAAILQQPLKHDDIEIKPDGIVYLPEIKYRRVLNKAFGPGGWGLAPRGETIVTGKVVTREYGLVCGGRLISIARGEQQYFDPDGIPTATEGCKSNALMRCCKDLGIASELWDPRFIRKFLGEWAKEMLVEHVVTKKRRKHWMRKDDELKYPFKEVVTTSAPGGGGGFGMRR